MVMSSSSGLNYERKTILAFCYVLFKFLVLNFCLYYRESEQLEVNRQFVPYTVDCERWSEIVAFCDVSHIPLNAGYDNFISL